MGVEGYVLGAWDTESKIPIEGTLGPAVRNYWDHLNSTEGFHTIDMIRYKLQEYHNITLRKIQVGDSTRRLAVVNEDSEEATMFKLKWG